MKFTAAILLALIATTATPALAQNGPSCLAASHYKVIDFRCIPRA